MVINQIDVPHISVSKTKDDAPICPNGHAPETPQVAFEGMESKAGEIHIFGNPSPAQNGKDVLNLFDPIRMESLAVAINKKPLKPLVPKTLDHAPGVSTALSSKHPNLTSDTCQDKIWKAGGILRGQRQELKVDAG
jgi:hypothetical protein